MFEALLAHAAPQRDLHQAGVVWAGIQVELELEIGDDGSSLEIEINW